MRAVAWGAVVASILGRALGPSLRGAREGLGPVIAVVDFAAFFATQMYAFAIVATTLSAAGRVARDKGLHPISKWLVLASATLVAALSALALARPLESRENLLIGVASCVLVLTAAREGFAVPRTRALALVLAATGAAGLVHLAAVDLAFYAGEHALYRAAVFARVLATGSVAFDLVALLTALTWLATRNRPRDDGTARAESSPGGMPVRWATRGALLAASIVAFVALHGGGDRASFIEVVAHRALQRLLSSPEPYVWLPFRYLLEALAPALAIVALTTPRQLPIVLSSLALALVGRSTADIPLCALSLAAAGLCTCIAARDERGIWADILASEGPTAHSSEIRLDVNGSGP